MQPTLVLDLDGTLCLGDAPVLLYAREALSSLPDDRSAAAYARVEAFLADRDPDLHGARDGYQAVLRLAAAEGVPEEEFSRAYLAARGAFESWLPDVHAPAALREWLGANADIRRVLVTNAVDTGLTRLLGALGLDGRLDAVVSSAGKPGGLLSSIPGECEPSRLASIGDIWVNDLAPIAELGGSTFYIDRHGAGDGTPTARGRTPDELVPALGEWADQVRL